MRELVPDPTLEGGTPENVMQLLGQKWIDAAIDAMPVEDVLKRFKSRDLLAGLRPEDLLAGLRPEDLLAGLKLEDVLKYYNLEERLTDSVKKEVILMVERKSKASTLLSQLQHRFVDIPDYIREKIANADSPTLEEWCLRIIDSKSLEDIFY